MRSAPAILLTFALVACGGNGSVSQAYTIGGTLGGLARVTLLNNNGGALTIKDNGSFTFVTPIADGSNYAVTVGQSPVGKICSVTSGSGTVTGGNATNVDVTCSTFSYTIGGTLGSLASGEEATLLNNGGDALIVKDNSSITLS